MSNLHIKPEERKSSLDKLAEEIDQDPAFQTVVHPAPPPAAGGGTRPAGASKEPIVKIGNLCLRPTDEARMILQLLETVVGKVSWKGKEVFREGREHNVFLEASAESNMWMSLVYFALGRDVEARAVFDNAVDVFGVYQNKFIFENPDGVDEVYTVSNVLFGVLRELFTSQPFATTFTDLESLWEDRMAKSALVAQVGVQVPDINEIDTEGAATLATAAVVFGAAITGMSDTAQVYRNGMEKLIGYKLYEDNVVLFNAERRDNMPTTVDTLLMALAYTVLGEKNEFRRAFQGCLNSGEIFEVGDEDAKVRMIYHGDDHHVLSVRDNAILALTLMAKAAMEGK